jgi:Cu/Ag efflux protein CusF
MSMRSVRTRSWLGLAVSMIAMIFVLGACKQEQEAPAATYTVRGVIKSLPTPGRSEVMFLHHEAVPTFVNREGKQSGMMSMSMPFGVASGVSLAGLEPGDKVELTFAVRWDRNPATQVTAIRELPADTALELSGF